MDHIGHDCIILCVGGKTSFPASSSRPHAFSLFKGKATAPGKNSPKFSSTAVNQKPLGMEGMADTPEKTLLGRKALPTYIKQGSLWPALLGAAGTEPPTLPPGADTAKVVTPTAFLRTGLCGPSKCVHCMGLMPTSPGQGPLPRGPMAGHMAQPVAREVEPRRKQARVRSPTAKLLSTARSGRVGRTPAPRPREQAKKERSPPSLRGDPPCGPRPHPP